jgi:hypothetical protein
LNGFHVNSKSFGRPQIQREVIFNGRSLTVDSIPHLP